MTRFAVTLAGVMLAFPALADEKTENCGYQAQVVAAVQQARKDRVPEREVTDHILAQDPTWPERFNNGIPVITGWVYEQRRRDIRRADLSAVWNELCLQLPDDVALQ